VIRLSKNMSNVPQNPVEDQAFPPSNTHYAASPRSFLQKSSLQIFYSVPHCLYLIIQPFTFTISPVMSLPSFVANNISAPSKSSSLPILFRNAFWACSFASPSDIQGTSLPYYAMIDFSSYRDVLQPKHLRYYLIMEATTS
jgi:hypothetical protein